MSTLSSLILTTYPGMLGSTSSAPATEWEESKATTSSGENPTEPKRDRIVGTLSNGFGTRLGGEAAFGGGRPIANLTLGAPGQLTRLRTPANWMLLNCIKFGQPADGHDILTNHPGS